MQNNWNPDEAVRCENNPLKLRVYSSRLLGKEPSLVLHGGGNTSVKTNVRNIFGESEEVLYVKGSGWDLATIKEEGFAPVRMSVLMKMAKMQNLTDEDMVREQRAAMLNPNAPAPSVEAILHALIPYTFVDHTHSDAVVAITNTPEGEKTIHDIFGDKILYIPYVMPGFILARKVYELTRDVDWKKYEGMILLNHGIFTFADDAQTSYGRMIDFVSAAEDYLKKKRVFEIPIQIPQALAPDLAKLARLRLAVSKAAGSPMVARLNSSQEACSFSDRPDVASIASRGPLTPDHVLHTKRVPLLLKGDVEKDLTDYVHAYKAYFEKNKIEHDKRHPGEAITCLDPAPRWAVWPGCGTIAFGTSFKRAEIIADISRHTVRAIQWAEGLGGWKALPEYDIFEVEYWSLEQAKLKKGAAAQASLPLQGKIALVTGAASGIGKACVEMLRAQGAAVAALDLNPKVNELFQDFNDIFSFPCDVTSPKAVDAAVAATVQRFGGLDILVSNAGSFPSGKPIADLETTTWEQTLNVNLHSHFYVLRACTPFLTLGIDPAVLIVGSKNVPAPGPGAAAYSSAKAGLAQLARVAALELAPKGIRVNTIHPNAVFDTGIWTTDVLQNRAKHYGMSVEEYKRNNLLQTEITSKDVARLVISMVGPAFSKTTGAQIPIDGGNDRVI